MKISRQWLNDYIDISSLSNKEIAEGLTRSGIEVEEVYNLSSAIDIVVGQITTVEPHPNADKLSICTVTTGNNVEYQVVCGASNVSEYINIAYAPVGSVIKGNEIKQVELRGIKSEGMICSLSELGVEDRLVEDEYKDGIVILPSSSVLGSSATESLKLDDTVFELSLTPNRSDCLSIIGVAYELSAIFNLPLINKVIKYPEINNDKSLINLFVSSNATSYFALMPIHKVTVKESPSFIKARLIASGIKPINNIVDITNYVLIETGQPMHAYDLHKVGTDFEVRAAFKNEKIHTLDDDNLILSPNDIVIANQENNLGLAGIMGSFSSRVTKYTSDLVLECGIFDSATIRSSTKKLNVRSDSSARFEKGVDINRSEMAMQLAVNLLIDYADAKVSTNPVVYKSETYGYDTSNISLSYDKLCKYLGMKIEVEVVVDILKQLQFSFTYEHGIFNVQKLSRRPDIQDDVCIIEEILRIYGLDNIEPKMPKLQMKRTQVDDYDGSVLVIKNTLNSMGYSEAINYSLTNETDASLVMNDDEELITITNPISAEREFLRKSLVPSLTSAISYNLDRQEHDVKLYELSKVAYKKGEEIITTTKLAGAISGYVLEEPLFDIKIVNDFYVIKGAVQKLFALTSLTEGVDYDIVIDENLPKIFHPYQSAKIVKDGEVIGYIGKIHPSNSKYDIYAFEIEFKRIRETFKNDVQVGVISSFPPIKRDLSILVPTDTVTMEMVKAINSLNIDVLKEVYVHDIYSDEKLGEFKSVTFRMTFKDITKTLEDSEINDYVERIISILNDRFDGQLR